MNQQELTDSIANLLINSGLGIPEQVTALTSILAIFAEEGASPVTREDIIFILDAGIEKFGAELKEVQS